MQKQKQIAGFFLVLFLVLGLAPTLLVSLFSASGPLSLVSLVQAKDGEDDSQDDGDNNESEDNSDDSQDDNNDDNGSDSKKVAEKSLKEAAKKKAERDREALKQRTEKMREGVKKYQQSDDDTQVGTDAEDQERDKKNDTLDESANLIDDVYEEIIKAEERIARAAAEGVDVSAAQARLAQAKEKVKALEALVAAGTSNKEELRSIAREVKKLARFASHRDVHSARDVNKDVSKVAKRITQTEGKIALLASVGGTGTSFTETLNGYKQEFEVLKTALNQGGDAATAALPNLSILERKIKVLKSSVENAIYALGGTDSEYDDNYQNEIEDWSGNLNDVAEIEGGKVGAVIKTLIAEQKMSGTKVGEALQSVDQRNIVLQTLFGAKANDLNEISAEIDANRSRIEKLKAAAAAISDPEVQAILNEQIAGLESETEKLAMFVSGQENRISLFGWFFHLF